MPFILHGCGSLLFCVFFFKKPDVLNCRPEDEHHPTVKPDGYVDNLAQAVDLILKYN